MVIDAEQTQNASTVSVQILLVLEVSSMPDSDDARGEASEDLSAPTAAGAGSTRSTEFVGRAIVTRGRKWLMQVHSRNQKSGPMTAHCSLAVLSSR